MTDANYAQLLEDLRRDLQLNPSTDLLPFAVASAQNLPWKLDVGSGAATFTASTVSGLVTVSHRLGVIPRAVVAMDIDGGGIYFNASSLTNTTFQIRGDYISALTGTFTFSWVAIG